MVADDVLTWLVIAGSVAAGLLASGMLMSARRPAGRFWPPGGYDWRWRLYIALSGAATGCLTVVAYLDWYSFLLPRPGTFVVGAGLIGIGGAGFVAAILDLGFEESSGRSGALRTGGFYRYSRNPQLVFLLVVLVGMVLAANSLAVLVLTITTGWWVALMPFAEEPWLGEQHGEEYEQYRRTTPRFVGPVTVRRLVQRVSNPKSEVGR